MSVQQREGVVLDQVESWSAALQPVRAAKAAGAASPEIVKLPAFVA